MKNLKIQKKLLLVYLVNLIGIVAVSVYGIFTINSLSSGQGHESVIIMVIGLIVVELVALILGLSVDRGITRPMDKILKDAKRLAAGDTNIQLKIYTKDELNELEQALYEIQASINNLIQDANLLNSAAYAGNLSVRADASSHRGAYRKVVEGMNNTLEAVVQPMSVLREDMQVLATGERREINDLSLYKGEFRDIMSDTNNVRLSVRALVEESVSLVNAALEGDLHKRADAARVKGSYFTILDGFNKTLDAVVNPIDEAKYVLGEVMIGNLGTQMKGDYKGDNAIIKDALNTTTAKLRDVIMEISVILDSMSRGNLDVETKMEYGGDFARLRDSLNNNITSLNELVYEINNAAEQVASGSGQVSAGNQAVSQGATEQAASIEELTVTIEGIAEQTSQNVANANESRASAIHSKQMAEEANEQMKEMLKSMVKISESSESISKIIKVIDDIAFQTNILALNAAVEAARAGAHGKGFAVVAEEVRNLAGKSAQAAKETAELIEGSVKTVEEGTKLSDKTAQALLQIKEGAINAEKLEDKIAAASEEQAARIMQVNQGINQMSNVVQSNSATAQQGAASSEELSAQAIGLKEMVERFNLRKKDGGSVSGHTQREVHAGQIISQNGKY